MNSLQARLLLLYDQIKTRTSFVCHFLYKILSKDPLPPLFVYKGSPPEDEILGILFRFSVSTHATTQKSCRPFLLWHVLSQAWHSCRICPMFMTLNLPCTSTYILVWHSLFSTLSEHMNIQSMDDSHLPIHKNHTNNNAYHTRFFYEPWHHELGFVF